MIPPGETMEIVAGHEPRDLLASFRERYGETFEWHVVENQFRRCRIRVTKTGSGSDDAVDGPSVDLDVRDLPAAARHERIFAAYEDFDRGESFVLVNDHDPKPLYHQFDAEAGPAFEWTCLDREPGAFRVRIGKTGGSSVDQASGQAG